MLFRSHGRRELSKFNESISGTKGKLTHVLLWIQTSADAPVLKLPDDQDSLRCQAEKP
jgi:hypothetical protein